MSLSEAIRDEMTREAEVDEDLRDHPLVIESAERIITEKKYQTPKELRIELARLIDEWHEQRTEHGCTSGMTVG